jgi:adenosylhomocysteine nucleosidase
VTRVLVLTAIDVEARALARHLGLAPVPGARVPHFAGGQLELAAVGVRGARLAERSAAWRAADLVISAGVCGALAPALAVGALVVPAIVVGADGTRWPAATLPRLSATGAMLTVRDVVESAAQKARLWMETGALAVDMESAPILAWAHERGVPAAVVRAVADDAERGVPAALAAAVGDDGRVRPLRAVSAALARATALGDLLELRAGTEAALKTVASALATLLRGPDASAEPRR